MQAVENLALKVLNHLFSSAGLAGLSSIPPHGEYRSAEYKGQKFYFFWQSRPWRIQLLIGKSTLLMDRDRIFKTPPNLEFREEKPFYVLEMKIENISSFEQIIEEIALTQNAALKIKSELENQTRANLKELKTTLISSGSTISHCWPQTPNEVSALELHNRLKLLKLAMSKEFSDACDKWNIPDRIWFPSDLLSSIYEDFLLSFDKPGINRVLSGWRSEFAQAKHYP